MTGFPTIEELRRPLFRRFQVEIDERGRWKIRIVLVGNTNFDSFILWPQNSVGFLDQAAF
jgi:hypothetical protein